MQIYSGGSLQTGDPGREPHVSEPLVIRLSKPIEAHDEQVTEIRCQEVTAGMLDGIEIRVDQTGCLIFDLACIARFLSNAGGIPTSSANHIAVRDLIAAQASIRGFFGLSPFPGTGADESKTSDTSSTGRQVNSTD